MEAPLEAHANPRKTIKIIHSISLLVIYNHWMKYLRKALPFVPPQHLFLMGLIYRLWSHRTKGLKEKKKKKHAQPYESLQAAISQKRKRSRKREEKAKQSLTDSCIVCYLSKRKIICKEEKMSSKDLSHGHPFIYFKYHSLISPWCLRLEVVVSSSPCMRPLFCTDHLI